jgi:DNA polymerase III subunit gamma/tau
MNTFLVSARKYRPARFDDVIGQPQVTQTLKNAIRQKQVAQAFLFCGPRGVGKTTCARILAKVINCENITPDIEACNECASCKSFNENASFNVHELDAASNNSVEDIRSLIDQVRYAPQAGKKKIYIIDEVHMLSQSAFNAFLKTLEEPPPYAIFILATTEKHKIIPTILSRCQIFDFHRIKTDDMANYLSGIATKEKIEADTDALHIISQKADGALRDALSMFDRIGIFGNGKITYAGALETLNVLDYDYFFKLTDCFLSEDAPSALLTLDEILQKGFDGENFLEGLASHFRSLLVCKDDTTVSLLDAGENLKHRYSEQSQYTTSSFLLTALQIINQFSIQYRTSRNKRLVVELALLKLCFISNAVKIAQQQAIEKAEVKKNSTDKPELIPAFQPAKSSSNFKSSAQADPVLSKSDVRLSSYNSLKKNISNEKTNAAEIAKNGNELKPEKIQTNELNEIWQEWIETVSLRKDHNLSSIAKAASIESDDENRIIIFAQNEIHANLLGESSDELIDFFRKAASAERIILNIRVQKRQKDQDGKKPYTSKEKFEHMAKKNPNLLELKNRLKLDWDY